MNQPCELQAFSVALGRIYTDALPSTKESFTLDTSGIECLKQQQVSVTFFTSNFDGSVIPVYTNSHATNIGIKLFINEQPIRFYQAYPSRTIADAQLSAQVVQYGGIPTAGYFSASVFIQLTNP